MAQALSIGNTCAGGRIRSSRTELNGLRRSFIRARDAALFAPNLISQGYNLSNISLPQFHQITDLAPSNAARGPLANNGGPMRAHELLGSSAGCRV